MSINTPDPLQGTFAEAEALSIPLSGIEISAFSVCKQGILILTAGAVASTIVYANPAFLAMTGLEKDAVIGHPPENLTLLEHNYDESARLLQSMALHTDFEGRLTQNDGAAQERYFQIHSSCISVSAGYWLWEFSDITEITRLKQQQEESHPSARVLSAIIEYIPQTIFLKNVKTERYELCNRSTEQMVGPNYLSMIGKTDFEFFPPHIAARFVAYDREVIAEKKLLDVSEEPIITTDGQSLVIQTTKIPLLNEAGEPEYILGISQDITARAQMETQLQEVNVDLECQVQMRTLELARTNEALKLEIEARMRIEKELQQQRHDLQVIFDLVPMMIFYKDTNHRVLKANKMAADIWGVRVDDVEGATAKDLALADAEQYHQDDLDVIRTGQPKLGHLTEHRLASGETVWTQADKLPYLDEAGNTIGVVVCASDITHLKKAEDELRRSEAKFRRIMDSNIIGIKFSTMQGRILEANDAFLNIVGYSREALEVGEICWRQLTPPELQGKDDEAVAALLAGQAVEPYEKQYITREGRRVHVLVGTTLLEQEADADPDPSQRLFVDFVLDISAQKSVEIALKQSQQRYQMVENATNDVIYDWDVIHDTTQWNQSAAILFRYPPSEIGLGDTWWTDRIHPEDRAAIRESVLSALAGTGHSWSEEYRFLRGDGTYATVMDRGYIIRDENGKAVRKIGTIMDLTERKQAEEALVASENKFHAIFDNALDGMIILDESSTVLEVNCAAAQLYGESWDKMLGKRLSELVPFSDAYPMNKVWVNKFWKEILQQGHGKGEFPLRCPDGSLKILSYIVVTHFMDGRHLCVVHDVSGYKQVESRLRRSLERECLIRQVVEVMNTTFDLRTILTSTVHAVGTFFEADRCLMIQTAPSDLAQETQYCSTPRIIPLTSQELHETVSIPGWIDSLGASRESYALGKAFLKSKTAENPIFGSYLERLQIQSILILNIQFRGIRYGLLALHQCSYDRDWSREDIGLLESIATHLGAAIYETELYQQEQDAKREAERANLRKDQFLANMSHEFRTPLNAILGYSQMLEEADANEPLNDKQQKYIHNIVISGQHLLSMVNDILDIAKIEAGHMRLDRKFISLAKVAAEVEAVFQAIALRRSVTLHFSIHPDLGDIYADEDRFRQILYNLLSNGIKFNNEGGRIFVRFFPSEDGSSLVCEIEDTGIGIPEESISKLFSDFYQVDSSLSRKHEGTGLGLALTRKLVEQHEGAISVTSTLNVGTTFRITLPLHPPKS